MTVSYENTQALESLTKAISDLTRGMKGGGGGGGGSRAGLARDGDAGRRGLLSKKTKTGGGLGGALGVLGKLGRAAGPVGLAVSAAVAAAPLVGGALIQRQRGGTSGAGAAATATSALAKIPFVGELTGFGRTADIQKNALTRLDSATNELAALGANFNNPEGRRIKAFFADVSQQRAIRFTADQRQNAAGINERIGKAAEAAGGVAGDLIPYLIRMVNGIDRLVAGGSSSPGGLF